MGSTGTPLLDILSTHIPSSAELSALSSSQSRSTVETLLSFALGAECPTRLPNARHEWLHAQPTALKALQDHLGTKNAKRARDSVDADGTAPKRQKTAPDATNDVDADADLDNDPPLFTLPNISTTSPVRKKVDVSVHARSIRFVHPGTRALEASIPLSRITRTFLLPTRGKTKGHWTVVLLPADIPDKSKTSMVQQVIFGLDARSAAAFETTSYSSGASTPNSAMATTTTVNKGEETAASVRLFLSYIPAPLYEPSATVFRSACANSKAGDCAAGIDAYLSAKAGTLWFFDKGILWGESKPCEFWAIEDLASKDSVKLISPTGRTCSVILSRKTRRSEGDEDDDEAEVDETVFSMVDGREQDPIHAWARNRKHLFGKSPTATTSIPTANQATSSSVNKSAGSGSHPPSGTVQGPAWDDSDPEDDDFEAASSEDLGHSGTDVDSDSSVGSGSGDEDGSQGDGTEGSEAEDEEEGEEELAGARHPLLQPGAVPRMSKAAIDMVVDLLDPSEEEDELEE